MLVDKDRIISVMVDKDIIISVMVDKDIIICLMVDKDRIMNCVESEASADMTPLLIEQNRSLA